LPFRETLSRFVQQHPSATTACCYLGLSADPRTVGVGGGNIWIYRGKDHEARLARPDESLEKGAPEQAYVSFPSLRDPKTDCATDN